MRILVFRICFDLSAQLPWAIIQWCPISVGQRFKERLRFQSMLLDHIDKSCLFRLWPVLDNFNLWLVNWKLLVIPCTVDDPRKDFLPISCADEFGKLLTISSKHLDSLYELRLLLICPHSLTRFDLLVVRYWNFRRLLLSHDLSTLLLDWSAFSIGEKWHDFHRVTSVFLQSFRNLLSLSIRPEFIR